VAQLIQELRGRMRLFLLSNTNAMHFDHIRRRFEVLEAFEEALLSFELGVGKPEPEIWREALRRAGLPPARCAYVDDILEYVETARRLGLKGLHFQGAGRLRRELEGAAGRRLSGRFP
jgi:putative hydrolase of the HAD superfamily